VTRGDILRYRIAIALSRARKTVRGLEPALTEQERYAVADYVVAQLKRCGDPWNLSLEMPQKPYPSQLMNARKSTLRRPRKGTLHPSI
jgi:hypothetical protein